MAGVVVARGWDELEACPLCANDLVAFVRAHCCPMLLGCVTLRTLIVFLRFVPICKRPLQSSSSRLHSKAAISAATPPAFNTHPVPSDEFKALLIAYMPLQTRAAKI